MPENTLVFFFGDSEKIACELSQCMPENTLVFFFGDSEKNVCELPQCMPENTLVFFFGDREKKRKLHASCRNACQNHEYFVKNSSTAVCSESRPVLKASSASMPSLMALFRVSRENPFA